MTNDIQFFSLKYDRIFKSIICNPDDTRVINAILSDILEQDVEVVKYITTEMPVNNKDTKVNTLDIILRTKDDLIINVEININFGSLIRDRNLGYYASLFSQYIQRGKKNVQEIIHIDLNFDDNFKNPIKQEFKVRNDNNRLYSKKFHIITVNVAEYKKIWYDKIIKGEKKHIYLVMLAADKKELAVLSKYDDLVKEVKDKVYILNADDTIVRTISREDEIKIRALDSGKEEGIKEGIKKGIKKGISEGIKEGHKQEQMTIAKKMLKEDMDVKTIAKITELSVEQVEDLKVKN